MQRERLYLLTAQTAPDFKASGFKARRDLDHVELSRPLDWDMDPFGDKNWCFQLHAWRMNDVLIEGWYKSGDPEYLNEAKKYALDWIDWHKESSNEQSWKDMATGLRAMHVAALFSFGRTRNLLSFQEEKILSASAVEHAERLIAPGMIKLNNHGLFALYGLSMLYKEVFETRSLIDKDLLVATAHDLVDSQYTSEGVHKENSPEYHFLVTKNAETLLAEVPLRDGDRDILKKAQNVSSYLIGPKLRTHPVGDSSPGPFARPLPRNRPVVCNQLECEIGDFTKSGYAYVRAGIDLDPEQQSLLFATGMDWTNMHKHGDNLSFIFYAFGELVLNDPGKYAYNDDPYRRYIVGPSAHNTVHRSDCPNDFPRTRLGGSCLRSLTVDGDDIRIRGDYEWDGFRQSRSLRYLPGRQLIIRDDLRSDSDLPFVSSLHLAPGFSAEQVDEGQFRIKVGESGHLRLQFSSSEPCNARRLSGETDPEPKGWSSPAYKQLKPTDVVLGEATGKDLHLVWVVDIYPA